MNRSTLLVLSLSVVACEANRFREVAPQADTAAAASAYSSFRFNSTEAETRAEDTAAGLESSSALDVDASATDPVVASSDVASSPSSFSSMQASGSESVFTIGAPNSEVNYVATDAGSAASSRVVTTAEPKEDLEAYAAGFHELYLHDECTDNTPIDNQCTHARTHEVPFTFGGDPEKAYDVRLRIRGLFEPTTIDGGVTPYAEHPYFKVGGTVTKADDSQWQVRISEPATTFYLNHYSETRHTIYLEDYEVTIPVRGGALVVVGVVDADNRQIDNGHPRPLAHSKVLEGVTDGVVDGQVLRIDVLDVAVAM